MNSRIIASLSLRQFSVAALGHKTVPRHVRLISAIYVSPMSRDILLPKLMTPNLQTYRYKSKKKSNKAQEETESDDEAENDEDNDSNEAAPGEKILKVAQLRIDKVTRLALNSSRLVDESFLAGKFWKNESKILKKSVSVVEGDIIDMEIGPDPKNPDFIKVHRVEILEVKEGTPHSSVRVSVIKNLTIKPHKT